MFSSFIWGNKPLKALLQINRSEGGLGLPNLQRYYWAANIQKIIHRAFYPEMQSCQLEKYSCGSSSLKALVCLVNRLKPNHYTNNPIIIATLTQIKQHFGWNTLPLNTPICNNELFTPAQIDARFSFGIGKVLVYLMIATMKVHFPASLIYVAPLAYNNLTSSGTFRFCISNQAHLISPMPHHLRESIIFC